MRRDSDQAPIWRPPRLVWIWISILALAGALYTATRLVAADGGLAPLTARAADAPEHLEHPGATHTPAEMPGEIPADQ